MKTEIQSITFSKDVRLQELQILSVDRLLDHSDIERYRVIVNDKNSDVIAGQLSNFKKIISYSLRSKIDIVDSSEYIEKSENGWLDQQFIKLISSSRSDCDWVIFMDSKNHFVHDTKIQDFFSHGKAKTVFGKPSPFLQPWLDKSLEYFSCKYDNFDEMAMPTITPYLLKPELVRLMIGYIRADKRTDDKENIFQSESLLGTSEFFLYYAFLKKIGSVNSYYENNKKLCETLFTVWPQNHQTVELFLNQLLNGEYPIFGIHRNRFPQLTTKEKELINKLWEPLNLPQITDYYLESI